MGLPDYGFRYLDPVQGRWPSRDPIWEEGGINLYGVAVNALVFRVDNLGLDAASIASSGVVSNLQDAVDYWKRDPNLGLKTELAASDEVDREIMALPNFKENAEKLRDLVAQWSRENLNLCGEALRGEGMRKASEPVIGIEAPVPLHNDFSKINTVGSVDLNVESPYKVQWVKSPLGFGNPSGCGFRVTVSYKLHFSYRNEWNLKFEMMHPIKTFFTDQLPLWKTGAGTSFWISGDFEYSDSVSFVICCKKEGE